MSPYSYEPDKKEFELRNLLEGESLTSRTLKTQNQLKCHQNYVDTVQWKHFADLLNGVVAFTFLKKLNFGFFTTNG